MQTRELKATGQLQLGEGSDSTVGRVVFQIEDVDTWDGSAVVKGRVPRSDAPLVDLPFTQYSDNSEQPAGTAITGPGIYAVDLPGVEVVLEYTHVDGRAKVHAIPLIG